jgi:hypothetical protein
MALPKSKQHSPERQAVGDTPKRFGQPAGGYERPLNCLAVLSEVAAASYDDARSTVARGSNWTRKGKSKTSRIIIRNYLTDVAPLLLRDASRCAISISIGSFKSYRKVLLIKQIKNSHAYGYGTDD